MRLIDPAGYPVSARGNLAVALGRFIEACEAFSADKTRDDVDVADAMELSIAYVAAMKVHKALTGSLGPTTVTV